MTQFYHHWNDLLCIFAATLFLIITVRKKGGRGLLLLRLGLLLVILGSGLGILHSFRHIDFVHYHHFAIWYCGEAFTCIGFGMILTLVFLGILRNLEKPEKSLRS